MTERIFQTGAGAIHYWMNEPKAGNTYTLIFLPGLTADHRLFEKQLEYFSESYQCLVWDAPGHASSRPFELNFSLEDKAAWLQQIMQKEQIRNPVIVGQSMGGYVGQMFCQLYPHTLKGMVFIDSAPLQRKYMTAAEIWMLKNTEPIYRLYPWENLVSAGAKGCAETEYGRHLMETMMRTYDNRDYARLCGHGYRILAQAAEANLPYHIDCPARLLCGEKDKAGSTKNYNKRWNKATGLPLKWIPNAGHNSNTDAPEMVNILIEEFVNSL